MQVQVSGWKPGIHAALSHNVLQVSLSESWYPAEGADVLGVPPGHRFRVWIAPALYYNEGDLRRMVAEGTVGTLVLQIDGRERELAL
jgi:hypothetical protein